MGIDHAELVEDLLEVESGLSDWEVDFIESISRSIEEYGRLTDRQLSKACEIADKVGVSY